MTLPVIQSLWIGKKLSVMEKLCISSFLQNGHPFHLYIYDRVEGIPEGAVIKDASTIIPADKIFKYKDHDSYAGFSNLFRYKLLLENGNYWVDTDVICLQPFLFNAEYVFAAERRPGEKDGAASCVIKVPVGSAIMDYCYRESASKDPETLKWAQTGPQLVIRAITKFDMWSCVAAPEVFCPIDWWNWEQFLNEKPDNDILACSHAVHLWNEVWRRNKTDKSVSYVESCIYEQLKKVYLKE